MTTYTTFLTLYYTPPLTVKTLNVVVGTWQETEAWMGSRGRAFSGRLLSTERDPRKSWTCTVEFMTGADLESFVAFVSSGLDAQFRPTGLRELRVSTPGTNAAMRSNSFQPTVLIHIGTRTPFEYTVGNVNTVGWSCELTIEEV